MKRNAKTQWIIIAYCVTLWATNWSVSTSYDRELGLTHAALDLRGLGMLMGGIITFVCLRRQWKLLRELLNLGVRTPSKGRIWGEWGQLWFLAPLAICVRNPSPSIADDGTLATTVFQYGGDLSLYSMLISASAIMLFQTVVNLESLQTVNEQNHGFHRSRSGPDTQVDTHHPRLGES